MATKNAISNKTQELALDSGSGDVFVQFNINGTGEFRIGNDATDDTFRISQGSALGTTDTFVLKQSGERTIPLQPAFSAYASAQANVTGDGTLYTLQFANEDFDQNNDFDGTSTFTAPVTGKYQFNVGIEIEGLTSSHTNGRVDFVTSSYKYQTYVKNPYAASASGENYCTFQCLTDLDASDTVIVQQVVYNGTKVVDIAAGRNSIFSGFLVC